MRVTWMGGLWGVAAVSTLLSWGAELRAQASPGSSAAETRPTPGSGPRDTSPEPASASGDFDLVEGLRGTGQTLTADEAARRAMQTAPSVARAEAISRRAQIAAEQAHLAVWPRLELEGRYTRVSPVTVPTLPGVRPEQIFVPDNFLLETRVFYPVSTLFFSVLPRYRAAQTTSEAQKLQIQVEAHTVGMRAREAYYAYARTRAQLIVARTALEQVRALRTDTAALVQAGTMARVELMRADAQVAAAEVAVSRAEGAVAAARAALATLLHVEATQDFALAEDFEAELPALRDDAEVILAQALQRRSEIKALRTMMQAHGYNIDAQQGDKLPVLSIGGNANYAQPNPRYFLQADEWNGAWAVFAALTWSPNDLGVASKAEGQARADLAQAMADLQELQDAVRVEVTQAYEDYNAARSAMVSARAGIAAAEESYRVRREQFRAGAAVATDVIMAEGDLRASRLQLIHAAIDARIAKARLDRAVEAER